VLALLVLAISDRIVALNMYCGSKMHRNRIDIGSYEMVMEVRSQEVRLLMCYMNFEVLECMDWKVAKRL
jgi:hypothetical protein